MGYQEGKSGLVLSVTHCRKVIEKDIIYQYKSYALYNRLVTAIPTCILNWGPVTGLGVRLAESWLPHLLILVCIVGQHGHVDLKQKPGL